MRPVGLRMKGTWRSRGLAGREGYKRWVREFQVSCCVLAVVMGAIRQQSCVPHRQLFLSTLPTSVARPNSKSTSSK